MADSVSSPASSARSNSAANTPKGRSFHDDFYLCIRKQPPDFVFPDEAFEFEFALEDKATTANSPPSDVEITVALKSIKGPTKGQQDPSLSLLEPPRLSPSRKTGKVRCRIHYAHLSRRLGCSFIIHVGTKQEESGITPCSTQTVHLVTAKIQVSTTPDWSSIWFKDEGGRDKSMEAQVKAFNKNGELVKNVNLPLSLTLCYAASPTEEKPVKVTNQEILRTLGPDSKLQIDHKTGTAKIRFRIEDVSKNHQRQNFVVKVACERSDIRDVAPGYTPEVSVRSKRNKRQRTTPTGGSGRFIPGMDRMGQPSPSEAVRMTGSSILSESLLIRDDSGRGVDRARLRDAVHGVMRWADEVVNGMYFIQWRVVGYGSHADGSMDYNRPYHNMQNPNALVDRVLTMYNESTREQLGLLQHVIEEATASGPLQGPPPPVGAPGDAGQPDPMGPDSQYHSRGPVHPAMSPPAMHPSAAASSGMVPPAAGVPPDMQPPNPPMFPGMSSGVGQERSTFGMPMSAGAPPGPQRGISPGPFRDFQQQQQQLHISPSPQHQSQHQTQQQQQQSNYFLPPVSQRRQQPSSSAPLAASPSTEQSKLPPAPPVLGRESEVEYVLAKQYKSVRTGDHLGFPAYSADHEILGFYRESTTNVGGGQFVPITTQDFGPVEIDQAKKILDDAIATKSDAVHALKDWGSIASLIDHCLVYDFSKDISDTGGRSGTIDR